jgi:nucleoside-diphosphate-sugar epimerase
MYDNGCFGHELMVNSMATTVLVTGSSGFVGKALCVSLRKQGYAVRAAVRTATSAKDGQLGQVLVGDLDEATDWSGAVAGVSVVVHAAARVHVMADTASDPLEAFRQVNVQGTLRLAAQAAQAGVRRFVYISSIKVLGEATQSGQAFNEESPTQPLDAYGVSKMEAEQGLRALAAQTGMEVVIIRPPLVYGPGVKANFAALQRAAQRGIPLPLGLVHNARSLVGLDNLVDFVVICVTHEAAVNQTFMVSDGQDVSTAELIRGMALAAGVKARLLPVPLWALKAVAGVLGKGDAMQRLCGDLQVDITKARRVLGWVPPVSVLEGLRLAIVKIDKV